MSSNPSGSFIASNLKSNLLFRFTKDATIAEAKAIPPAFINLSPLHMVVDGYFDEDKNDSPISQFGRSIGFVLYEVASVIFVDGRREYALELALE
jgi:hypothetical protein